MSEAWREALAAARRLGLSPRQFWALSLAEWRALLAQGAPAMRRETLAQLLERFPDRAP